MVALLPYTPTAKPSITGRFNPASYSTILSIVEMGRRPFTNIPSRSNTAEGPYGTPSGIGNQPSDILLTRNLL